MTGRSPRGADLVRQGIAAGLLPGDATPPAAGASRPWPVVLLTAVGAWLASIPLVGVVGLVLGDLLMRDGPGAYIVGLMLLGGTLALLRQAGLSIFVEQLAVALACAGALTLGFGLFRDLPANLAAALALASTLGYALLLDRPWLRTLLGALAAGLCMATLMPFEHFELPLWGHALGFWLAPHVALALWLAAVLVQARLLGTPAGAGRALLLEQLGAGWLPVVVAALAWQSGATFLLGAAMDPLALGGLFGWDMGDGGVLRGATVAASVLLALAAALRVARAWPALRHPAAVGVALVLAALCLLLPSLGGVLLALAVTAATRRWRLAACCGLAAAWILGSSYYQLAWPLAHKAAALAAAGALLAALAWWAWRGTVTATAAAPAAPARAATWGMALTAVATLAAVNWAIRDKEAVIAQGQPVFIALAPVDPRSLMQGDYMALRFALPPLDEAAARALPWGARPHVVARADAHGVARIARVHQPGAALAEGEFLIELSPKNGGWMLVSDAWYFREGHAERFEQARFGEFRVAPDGRALLVGMADAQLRPIAP